MPVAAPGPRHPTPRISARTVAALALAAATVAALAGCGSVGSDGSAADVQIDTLPSATSTLVVGQATAGSVAVSGARVVEGRDRRPASIYFDVRTTGGPPETLDGITSSAGADVTLTSAAGATVPTLAVPPSGSLVLAPGGPRAQVAAPSLHLGGTVALNLTFAHAGAVTVFAYVTAS